MQHPASRFANLSLNTALFALGILAVVLLYSLVMRFAAPRVDPTREANPGNLIGRIIQVEVRNACGVPGLAAAATMYLRERGFDVVEVGDYETFDLEHSVVIDRVGDLESARKVASVMGIPEERIQQEIRLDYYLDASVIIGKDYESLRSLAGSPTFVR